MASATKKTEYRRKLRRSKAGRKAKNRRERLGSTPVFPVHTPEADENAPQQVSPKAAE